MTRQTQVHENRRSLPSKYSQCGEKAERVPKGDQRRAPALNILQVTF